MQIIRGLHNIRHQHKQCVAAIGNFDGVHRGHQGLFKMLHGQALSLGGVICAILFEPQPAEFFLGESAPARLSSFREKMVLLRSYGIEQVLCLSFGDRLRGLGAYDFVKAVLVDSLAVKFLVLGDDFRYGYKRKGELIHLKTMGREYGFDVCSVSGMQRKGHRVSSSLIRSLLEQGDTLTAQDMLGHPFTVIGRVIAGQQRGRELGFPTANILSVRRRFPLHGVFAVRVLCNNEWYIGVANVGVKPTFKDRKCSLEVFIMGFNGCLYGQLIQVTFVKKIRNEHQFKSRTLLKEAIERDVQFARQALNCAVYPEYNS